LILYTEAPVDIKGNVTIDGKTRPGIVTTLDPSTITGKTDQVYGEGFTPSITHTSNNISIQETVDFIKGYADYVSPNLPSGSTWGTSSTPVVVSIAGDIPKLGGNATCSGGYGIILVEGDLRIDGSFTWNGLIICTGTIQYIGTGNGKITGGVMAGELNFTGESSGWGEEFGGNAEIEYADMSVLFHNLGTVRIVSWKEIRG
jgi:hypothetical protein